MTTNKPTELVPTQAQQEAELGLLYNYTKDDSPQFTRWQMMTAIAHGYRLASTAPASEGEVERKGFPVLGSQGAIVDWQFVHDHGKQANDNHRQSVERLAERGGLSWCELHAVVHNRKYEKIDTNEAMLAVRSLEARYLAALRPRSEREEIVAWLRSKAVGDGDRVFQFNQAADAIERGDFKEPGE